jgi:hypothetical protein
LFRHGFTDRFARVAKIAEELFFNFLLSPSKKQRDASKGRKLKIQALRAIESRVIYNPSRISSFLPLRPIALYVCRPLKGKHKTNILSALCGSAVNKAFNFNKKCLTTYCRISMFLSFNG